MQTLVHVGLANAVLAVALALLVIGIMRIHYNPFAARALWLVVLARLVMPPVLNVPLPVPAITLDRAPDLQSQHRGPSEAAKENPHRFTLPFNGIETSSAPYLPGNLDGVPATEAKQRMLFSRGILLDAFWMCFCAVWLIGAIVKGIAVFTRALRFDRLIQGAKSAAIGLQNEVTRIGEKLGLRQVTDVRVVEAQIAPMIWTFRRHPILLLPRSLLGELDAAQRSTILAHELSHLRRHDHWVRYFEMLVSVLYWWHPIVGFSLQQLRQAEEECCDAAVLQLFPSHRRLYSEVLLRTAEFVSGGREVPLMASPLGQAHQLKRRVAMMTQLGPVNGLSRWWLVFLSLFAIVVLPPSACGNALNAEQGVQTQVADSLNEDGEEPHDVEPNANTEPAMMRPFEWTLAFEADVVTIVADANVPVGYFQGTIAAIRRARHDKFTLRNEPTTWKNVPTIRIRFDGEVATVSATRTTRVEELEAVISQLRAAAIKDIALCVLNADESAEVQSSWNAPVLDGVVESGPKEGLVTISVGADDGLRVGAQLTVYRGTNYLGRIEIQRLEAKRAVAAVLGEFRRGRIKKGDRVTTLRSERRGPDESSRTAPAVEAGTTQVLFDGPHGMTVCVEARNGDDSASQRVVCPGRINLDGGKQYRLSLTKIPTRQGLELLPSLEIAPATLRSQAYIAHNPIPIQFSAEDFDQALSGNFVTKVVYLPDPQHRKLAVAGIETLVSSRLDPHRDPLVEADRRGTILAILRLGRGF